MCLTRKMNILHGDIKSIRYPSVVKTRTTCHNFVNSEVKLKDLILLQGFAEKVSEPIKP
jgi:hypothetical protein